MDILKGRMHITFGDLQIGETFMSNGSPCIKVGGSAGAKFKIVLEKIKEDPDYLNMVDLKSGILFHKPKNDQVEKVKLGVTGLETLDE